MQRVKLGIIGCGVIGNHHLPAAKADPGIEILAVADLLPDRVGEAVSKYGVPRSYSEGSDLIADADVEAVVLALPAKGRAILGPMALEAGKHLLLEKPVARSAAEVEGLLAMQGDRVAACASSRYRFLESAEKAEEIVASGVLGNLRLIRARGIRPAPPKPDTMPPNWRLSYDLNGGGILSNWGCYDLDYLLGTAGWKLIPVSVSAHTWQVPPGMRDYVTPNSDAETHVHTTILCESGTVISLERGEYMLAEEENSWQIIGDKASLTLRMLPSDEKKIILHEANPSTGLESKILWQGVDDTPKIHQGPLQDFCRAIREDQKPKTSLRQALTVQKIFDATYASAKAGASVPIQ